MEKMMDSKLESFHHELHSSKNQRQKITRKEETKMADYEKKISSIDKEIINIIKHLNKQKKLIKHQEPVATVSEHNDAEPDSAAPIQEAQNKTSMGKGKFEKEQEFSLFLPHSESNFDNSFDELTCLEPVQPSRIVSVSQVAKEDSAEKEPESTTQEEQQKNLQTESAHESLSYDLHEHCNEFNMVASVPGMFVKVSTEDIKRFGLDKFSEFELDCLCAENDSKHVGWFFDDILVYNTFFDKPAAQLKLDITDSECVNLNLNDIGVYNTFFDMITHLTCPKRAEKCTGKKRGYTDESLAKLEMQQSNLGNSLAASFYIGAVRGVIYQQPQGINQQNRLLWKLNSSGSHVELESCPKLLRKSQSYLWQPGEHAKIIRKLGSIQGERTSMRKIRDSNHLI
ncbi:hypothetical protein Bca4012_043424 [Brassica carinata]